MTVRHHLIIIKEIAENYKIKELVLESINSFCVANLILLLSSVQYNQTFNTTPAGNSRQFYPRLRYSPEHCTHSRNYRGFHIFFNPVPAEYPQVWSHTHARAKLYTGGI